MFASVVGKHRADVRQLDLVAADGAGNRADLRAHAEALVADPVGHREVAHAARAGRGGQRADQRPVDRLRQPEKLKKPVKVCHQCGSGTNAMLIGEQEQEHDRQHRPGEVLEHALDGAAEGQDQDDGAGSGRS